MNPVRFLKIAFLLFPVSVVVFGFYSYSWCMPNNRISAIRFGGHKSFNRITIDLKHKPRYRIFSLKNPSRVVVDIDDCILPQVHQDKNVEGTLIVRVRASQYSNKTARIVLDLKEKNQPHVFYLPPEGTSLHRLVLDVKYPYKEGRPRAFQKLVEKESGSASRLRLKGKAEALLEKNPVRTIEPFLKQTEKKNLIIISDSFGDTDLSLRERNVPPKKKTLFIKGFIEAKGAMDTEKKTENEHRRLFRNKVRLEGKWSPGEKSTHKLNGKKDKFYALASIESDYLWFGSNHSNEDYDFDLYEGYLHWTLGSTEIKLGKQIVRWGKTDQVSPVDNLNSHDFREFIIPDLEDRKIPNWMAKIRIFPGAYNFEGVYIPFFEPSRIDYFGTDWSVYQHVKQDVRDLSLPLYLKEYLQARLVHETEPAKIFENGQWGVRLSGTISGWDLGFNYLYAWESLPHYESFPIKNLKLGDSFSSQNLLDSLDGMALMEEDIEVNYKRSKICGFEFETIANKIGLRGEAAYFNRQSFLTESLTSVRKPVFFYVLGADYLGENDWYINFQFSHQIISGHDDEILYFRRNNVSLNGEISKEFLMGNLEAIVGYHYSLSDESYYIYPKIIYKYITDLEILLGFNIFGGDTDTFMGFYDANDQVFLSFKYYM